LIGDNYNQQGTSLALDPDNDIYLTGYFEGDPDLDPGPGTAILSAAGSRDVFVEKLDASGNFLWAVAMGGPALDASNDITLDRDGNVYTTGLFYGTCDFDPGPDSFNLTATAYDLFVHKLASTYSEEPNATSSVDIGMTIFPNPADHTLLLTNLTHAAVVDLFDSCGRLVLHTGTAAQEISIDVASLDAGLYQLRISNREGARSFKLVVQ
jgi:hypothetical protein